MSIISNRHNVVAFESGKSKPFQDQRLAKVGYKTSTDKVTKKEIPAKFPSVCASIPEISGWTEQQNQRLRPYFVTLLEDTQDKIFRSLYESSDGSLSNIGDDDLSIDQCISYLESEATGDRLTKEKIGEWFDSSLRDNLTVVICEKLQTEDLEDSRVGQHLTGYRQLFCSLSKDSGSLQEAQVKGLRNAITVCAVDDEIGKKLASKLDGMMNRPKLADLLELN